MRFIRQIIPVLFVTPLFLAFQLTFSPFAMCTGMTCSPEDCEKLLDAMRRSCLDQSQQLETNCCMREAMEGIATEPCEQYCSWMDFACAESADADAACGSQMPFDCDDPESCPLVADGCRVCVPIRFETVPFQDSDFRELQYEPELAVSSSMALADSDDATFLSHAASPPTISLARNGPQLRIEHCSFLL